MKSLTGSPYKTLSTSTETTYRKATCRYAKVNERYFYVVRTGCKWQDISSQYFINSGKSFMPDPSLQ